MEALLKTFVVQTPVVPTVGMAGQVDIVINESLMGGIYVSMVPIGE